MANREMTWEQMLGADFWWMDFIVHSNGVTFRARIREYDQMMRVYGCQAREARKLGNKDQEIFCMKKSYAYECALKNERVAMHEGYGLR